MNAKRVYRNKRDIKFDVELSCGKRADEPCTDGMMHRPECYMPKTKEGVAVTPEQEQLTATARNLEWQMDGLTPSKPKVRKGERP